MEDFIAILHFLRDCMVSLFTQQIPLGTGLTIAFGSIVLGRMAFPILMKVLFRLFSDAGALAENQSDKGRPASAKTASRSKGGSKK